MRSSRSIDTGRVEVVTDSNKAASVAIILSHHLLLWSSLYIVGSVSYTLIIHATNGNWLTPAILMIVTGSISLFYVVLHTATSLYSLKLQTISRNETKVVGQWVAKICLRLAATLWLITCGIAITFTIARQSSCLPEDALPAPNIDVGTTCIVQRTSVASSLLALIISGVLFVLMQKLEEPFRYHLFGVLKQQPLLPLTLPYHAYPDKAMFSEMSFKCRSSTSLSSHTLVPSISDSTTDLLPKKPEKTVGLGIYASKDHTSFFLAPRPSLSTIRLQTKTRLPPPSSPLPPLPAYFPARYRRGSAMHKAVYPPNRPRRPDSATGKRTVRIVPSSPALSFANLAAYNRSQESLSSVYSRSISGESYSTRSDTRPGALIEGVRSYSSSSTATQRKSPLDAMRLASDPDLVVTKEGHRAKRSESSESDINDVATLQARLPPMKPVSEFGEVESWATCQKDSGCQSTPYHQKTSKAKPNGSHFKSLLVNKTRRSINSPHSKQVQAVA